jgi:threonine/homoserine/homoserine lactone efflux protein
MRRSKFTTREGMVMLFGLTVGFIVVMWLVLSGILQIND